MKNTVPKLRRASTLSTLLMGCGLFTACTSGAIKDGQGDSGGNTLQSDDRSNAGEGDGGDNTVNTYSISGVVANSLCGGTPGATVRLLTP